MALTINTNLAALSAQRNLQTTQLSLGRSLERLSSGLRINSAADDAAGLAIATKLRSQSSGLAQAQRNINDGISMVGTGDAALSAVTDNLQRMRELALQSANGTLTASDRALLNEEYQALSDQITTTADSAAFNGLKLLDGTFGSVNLQIGSEQGQTISFTQATDIGSDGIGQIATDTGTEVTSNALTDGGLTIAVGTANSVSIGATSAGDDYGQEADSAYAKAAAINAAGVAGLTTTADNSVTSTFTEVGGTTSTATYTLIINNQTIYSAFDVWGGDGSTTLTGDEVAEQINLYQNETGVTASWDSGLGEMTLSTTDGRNIVVNDSVAGGQATNGFITATGATQVASSTATTSTAHVNRGTITMSANDNIVMTGQFAEIGMGATISLDSTTLDQTDVLTDDAANEAIGRIDAALSTVTELRARFGATSNRLASALEVDAAQEIAARSSESTIRDADFATETANLSRAQILQSAGISVLAQANQLPQSVLQLLQ